MRRISPYLAFLTLAVYTAAGPAAASDHQVLNPESDGTTGFMTPDGSIVCRSKPANVLHKDWPGEYSAALSCGRLEPVNQRFVLNYKGPARIEPGQGGLDCCGKAPVLQPGMVVDFSYYACRIEAEGLHCSSRDERGFLIGPKDGKAW